MADWRNDYADQNLRMAQKMLEQQGEINRLAAQLAAAEKVVEAAVAWRGYAFANSHAFADVRALADAVDAYNTRESSSS